MTDDNFHVGLKLSLEVNKSYDRIDMFVAGWVRGAFVLATSPHLRKVELCSKDDCVIRFLKEGSAFGFQTAMLIKQQYPLPMIFLKYPEDVRSMPFRKTKRVKTNIQAKLLKQKGEKEFITDDARIVDISETGCLLEISESKFNQTEVNSNYFLTFMILDKSLEIDCVVRGNRISKGNYLLGSEFSDLSDDTRELLKSFVSMFTDKEDQA
ncbi:MAG: PilZ domain-containing protein [Dissulfurispiraceae bacterium]